MKKVISIIAAAITIGCATVPNNYEVKNSKPTGKIREMEKIYTSSDLEKIATEENRIHWDNNFYIKGSDIYKNEGFRIIEEGLGDESVIFIHNYGFDNYSILKHIKDVKIKTHLELMENTIDVNLSEMDFDIRNGKSSLDFNYGSDAGFYRTNPNS